MTRASAGFTLIEVMIAIGITAVLGAMMAGTFQRAYAARETVDEQEERYGEVQVALGRMAREVSGAFLSNHFDPTRFRDRPTVFRGRSDDLLFATMSHERLLRDAKESDQAVVEYALDSDPDFHGEQALFRREKARIDDDPEHGGARAVLCQHVVTLQIDYWDWTKQEWAREWNAAAVERQNLLPTRVRVRLTLKMPDGKQQRFETQARIAIIRPLDF